jgi:polysaccharide export outer membrane protein
MPTIDVMQALSLAQGATAFASLNDIIVLRQIGDTRQAIPFRYSDVARGRDLGQNIDLITGDVVVVP